jgi:hypothetical protein
MSSVQLNCSTWLSVHLVQEHQSTRSARGAQRFAETVTSEPGGSNQAELLWLIRPEKSYGVADSR